MTFTDTRPERRPAKKKPVDPAKQKKAKAKLEEIARRPDQWQVIHYSCESFYDRPNGQSPRITSLAIRDLVSGQTKSFSIHQMAEKRGIAPREIAENYDGLEKAMLDQFFQELGRLRNSKFLHWNMRDANYGFQAIEHRFEVLGGTPTSIPNERKADLARLLVERYGRAYTGHPRLTTLMEQNSIEHPDFLSGKEEAQAFDDGEFVKLHQSTLRKVDVIANVFERASEGSLATTANWWHLNGGRLISVTNYIGTHPLLSILGIILAGTGVFLGLKSL